MPNVMAALPGQRRKVCLTTTTMLSGHVEEVLLFNKFFPIVDTFLSSEDIARQCCAMVSKWRFLRPVFYSEPRAAHFRHAF